MTTPTPGWGYEEPANDAARPPEDHRVEPVGYDLGDPPAFEQPPLMVPIGQASPSYLSTGQSMAGLVLSLAGTVFGLFIPLVSLPFSAAGITVSAIALSRCRRGLAAGRGQAIAGLVVGILGILLFLVEVVAFVSIFSSPGP